MGLISVKNIGNFYKFYKFAKQFQSKAATAETLSPTLDDYGRKGVQALAAATPVESGLSAQSWRYRIFTQGRRVSIEWFNDNVDDEGTPIVILLQYGHGTGTGGYVSGHDFINPVMRPIFDAIEADVWKKVTQ